MCQVHLTRTYVIPDRVSPVQKVVDPCLDRLHWHCFYWVKSSGSVWRLSKQQHWEVVCKSVKPPALQLGLLFYAEGFSRFSAYKRHIFYATRLRPPRLTDWISWDASLSLILTPAQTSLFATSSQKLKQFLTIPAINISFQLLLKRPCTMYMDYVVWEEF